MVRTYRNIQLELALSSSFKCQGLSQWIVCLKFPRSAQLADPALQYISCAININHRRNGDLLLVSRDPKHYVVPNSKVPNPKYTNTKQYQYHDIFIFLYIYTYSYVFYRCHVIMLYNSLISSFNIKHLTAY